MNIEDIIAELEYNETKFPGEALKQAIEEKDLITPILLQVLKDSTSNIQELNQGTAYMFHIYALYLLAQFKEVKAYPLIVDFFSIPGEITLNVTGDVVTEDLGRILASTFDGDVNPIKRLIEDENVNEYVRSASLEALSILWGTGKIPRQQLVDYYHFLFSDKLVGEESYIWTALISNSTDFSPNELEEDIEAVFAKGLVETFFIGLNDVKKSLGLSNEAALKKFNEDSRYKLIEDTIHEMKNWACFQPEREIKPIPAKVIPYEPKPKIGRNASCPCGSGKKYKKCCL